MKNEHETDCKGEVEREDNKGEFRNKGLIERS